MVLFAAAALWATAAVRAPAESTFEVAITIDDLPWVGPAHAKGRITGNDAILAALATHGAPAAGFVVCERVTGARTIVKRWIAAGHVLGNHHHDHGDLNTVPPDRWLAGARRCHRDLTRWLGSAPAFFRYPYLRNGTTAAVRDRVRGVITDELGEVIARVSADNHEWKFAQLYGKAVAAGQTGRAADLAEAYVEHIVEAVAHARKMARAKTGADIRHVLLLHANALNADHLDRVLGALTRRGARFVTLERALADPVYARPDAYAGKGGISWLYRIAPVTPSAEWTFEETSWAALIDRFGR